MRRAAVVTLLCLGLALPGCGKSSKRKEYQRRADALVAELAEMGVEIDDDDLSYELGYRSKAREDLDRQQKLFFGPGYYEATWIIRNAIGLPALGSPEAFRAAAMDGFGRSISAYYQHDRKALVFMDSTLSKLGDQDQLVAHELVHAHQDQQEGGLARYLDRESLDRTKAAHGMIEGAAEVVSLALIMRREGKSLADLEPEMIDGSLSRMLVGEELSILYEVGTRYLLARHRAGTWKPSDPTAGEPPASTEQLMHLEKAGDTPTAVILPGWPDDAGPAEEVDADVAGELAIYVLWIELGLLRDVARRAAIGWDGDRFATWRLPDGGWALAWRLVWDRPEDAQHAATLLAAQVDERGHVQARGHVVDLAASSSPPVAAKLMKALLETNPPASPPASDAASTEALERAIDAEVAQGPRVEGDWWVHPRHGVRIPVPPGFRQLEVRGNQVLIDLDPSGFSDNITAATAANITDLDLEEIRDQTRAQMKSIGAQIDRIEITERGGQKLLSFEYHGRLGGPFEARAAGVLALRGDTQVIVTFTVKASRWPRMKETVRETLAGVDFGPAVQQ